VIDLLIRKATIEDALGIAKVHVDSWRTTYKAIVPDVYLDGLSYDEKKQMWKQGTTSNNVYVAVEEKGQIIGFSVGGKERTGKYESYIGELYAIYLLKEYQGKGIGKLLVQSVIDDLQDKNMNSMLIWALKDNPACYFYKAIGGVEIDSQEIEIAGKNLKEVAYGWGDITQIGLMK